MQFTEIFTAAPTCRSYLCNANAEKNRHVAYLHLKNNFEDLFQVVCNTIHTPLILKLGGEPFSRHKIKSGLKATCFVWQLMVWRA